MYPPVDEKTMINFVGLKGKHVAFRVVGNYTEMLQKLCLIESTWFLSHILLFMYVAMENASDDEATSEPIWEHKTSQFII